MLKKRKQIQKSKVLTDSELLEIFEENREAYVKSKKRRGGQG